MGVIFTYFAAATDDAAASTIDSLRGPGGPATAAYPTIEDTGFDPVVQCGTLEALLTSRAYEDVGTDPRWGQVLAQRDGGERLVVSLTDSLISALADSSPEGLRRVSIPWAQTEEFFGRADPEVLAACLEDLSALARAARTKENRLYCWVCV